MRVERGPLGGITVHGMAEEWARFGAGLEDLYAELVHDVLPAAADQGESGVIVTLREALAIMAVLEDEELTRSLLRLVLEG
jgi:hypothetical protein